MLESLIDGIKKAITGAKNHEESIGMVVTGLSQFLECYKNNSPFLTDPVFERLILEVIDSYAELSKASEKNRENLKELLEYLPSETETETETEIDLKSETDWGSRKV